MKRTSRALAAVVAATALTFTGIHTADAKPAHAGSHAKAAKADKTAKATSGKGAVAKDPATKLARHVARVLAQLDRAVNEKRLAGLSEEDRNAVLANVELDRSDIAAVLTKADLRGYRVENYRLSVNILRQAAKAAAAATEAGNADAGALVTSAVEKARAIRATSPKADVKDARADLSAARELLEPEESDVAEGELAEGEAGDGSDPVVGLPSPESDLLSEPVDAPDWASGS